MMNARSNTNLIVLPKVMLTPIIEPVIVALDPYFRAAGEIAFVTSGKRSPLNQLQIIQDYLLDLGLAKQYPEAMSCKVTDTMRFDGYTVFKWQPGWSALLNHGIIINPPFRAKCLMDYWRNGVNKKGYWINPSPHFRGTAFDIGGGANGIADELKVVEPLIGKVPGLINLVIERKNNCLHFDCAKIDESLPI